MKTRARVLVYGALVALLASVHISCATGSDTPPFDSSMFGMIYGRDGSPVGEARIFVDGELSAVSDSGGRFFLASAAPGVRALEVSKPGYETWRGSFERRETTDVLYIKLVSAAWLIDEAERAASVMDWPRSLEAIERALAVEPDNPVAAFILGICALRSPIAADQARRAADLLEDVATRGEREPSLYLLLAELYGRRLDDPEAELRALERVAEARSTAEVAERISVLKALLGE